MLSRIGLLLSWHKIFLIPLSSISINKGFLGVANHSFCRSRPTTKDSN
ncbi:hypothetical protein AVDCRST_MAG84-3547 [uncultured Microcoleus sp.]|uniref:Uncharacterized protein n=1 Tax=uncultured Microcoleus sp. TaxID=259945 RepID=A0A6J4MN57_9CYAN|nr:hypothetical protein AVDCRST_MAG84-3547 [uncultured Microcoleus sp.]